MIKYIRKMFKNGWEYFWRQGFLSFATALVIFIAAILGTALYFFQGGVNYLTQELKDKIDISVTFKEEVARDSILSIREELVNLPEVKNVEYISPEEAYDSFIKAHEGDKYLEALELISVNPFLPSLRIQTKQPSQYKQVSEYLKQDQFKDLIDEINDYKRGVMIERLSGLTNSVSVAGILVTLFLSLIAVVVTFNTLRLSIYSQKEEIGIMRLVGAKNSFIRGPFLVQGILCGAFAAILSFFLFLIIPFIFNEQLETLFLGFDCLLFFKNNFFWVFILNLVIGMGLGLISSYFAVRKYLKD